MNQLGDGSLEISIEPVIRVHGSHKVEKHHA
jgi:hypothetical protein